MAHLQPSPLWHLSLLFSPSYTFSFRLLSPTPLSHSSSLSFALSIFPFHLPSLVSTPIDHGRIAASSSRVLRDRDR
ncbi:hypothetical protein BDV06DRAFT_163099 [Aspergillus oleicola]